MKKARKDDKGRALKQGEYQRYDRSYEYRYKDPFNKRKCIYAPTLMELREQEKELMRDQLDGLDVYAKGMATVNMLYERYIRTKVNLRPTTLAAYAFTYDRYVRDLLGKKRIGEVKYSDILYFYNYLMKERNLKAETVDKVHTLLHPMFTLAVRDNIIRKNPTDGAMATIKQGRTCVKTTRHALTKEQQRCFLEYVAGNPFFVKWLPLFTVLLGTGCRVGEVTGLRWEDIDLKKKMISINHNLVRYSKKDPDEGGTMVTGISLPKTEAGIRTIPMFPQVEEAFMTLWEEHKENMIETETIDGMNNFIFVRDDGTVLSSQAINDVIKRVIKFYNEEEKRNAKAEKREPVLLPDFSCHHLRHTFCTRFCETEKNVKVVQSVMGHADITTTLDIYTDVTESVKTEAMLNLAASVDVF